MTTEVEQLKREYQDAVREYLRLNNPYDRSMNTYKFQRAVSCIHQLRRTLSWYPDIDAQEIARLEKEAKTTK